LHLPGHKIIVGGREEKKEDIVPLGGLIKFKYLNLIIITNPKCETIMNPTVTAGKTSPLFIGDINNLDFTRLELNRLDMQETCHLSEQA
jgi:hypothetical protein